MSRTLALLAGAALAATLGATFPFPTTIHLEAGDVPIRWTRAINCGGVDARGCYDYRSHQVWIITGMSADSTLETIRHEQCHASLDEARIRVAAVRHLDSVYADQGEPEDYVCEAMAWAWLHQRQHGHF